MYNNPNRSAIQQLSLIITSHQLDVTQFVIRSSRTPQQKARSRVIQQMMALLFAISHQTPMVRSFHSNKGSGYSADNTLHRRLWAGRLQCLARIEHIFNFCVKKSRQSKTQMRVWTCLSRNSVSWTVFFEKHRVSTLSTAVSRYPPTRTTLG